MWKSLHVLSLLTALGSSWPILPSANLQKLPISREFLVGAPRFELGTPSPPDWCANRAALRSENLAEGRFRHCIFHFSLLQKGQRIGYRAPAAGRGRDGVWYVECAKSGCRRPKYGLRDKPPSSAPRDSASRQPHRPESYPIFAPDLPPSAGRKARRYSPGVFSFFGARDRHDVLALRQHPRQRKLAGRAFFLARHLLDPMDQCQIAGEVFRSKSRMPAVSSSSARPSRPATAPVSNARPSGA